MITKLKSLQLSKMKWKGEVKIVKKTFYFTFFALNGTSLKIVNHNARLLQRHLIDVKSDCNLLSADILAFSETRFQPTDTGDFNLPEFKIARFDSTNNL